MGKMFSNVKAYPGEDMLYQEEIDVILEILGEILPNCNDGQIPERGSFALYGQKEGAPARCIVSCNLRTGGDILDLVECDISTDAIAEISIFKALDWPNQDAYPYLAETVHFGKMPTNIYTEAADFTPRPRNNIGRITQMALVINTTLGRFIASFQAYPPYIVVTPHLAMRQVLISLTEIFRQLGKEDLALQIQSEHIVALEEGSVDTVSQVRQLFATCDLPALQHWKSWHESAIQHNALAVFFG